MFRVYLLLLSMIFSLQTNAANKLFLAEIYNDSVLLIIDDREVSLALNQTVDDVRLLEFTSYDAVLSIHGQRQRLRVGSQIKLRASYQRSRFHEVVLERSTDGHYWAPGEVNGRKVDFLVDTGASYIAINESMADYLGVGSQKGKQVLTQTANGSVAARLITLDRISIGDIVAQDVKAIVTPNKALPVPLLGNSFLNRVAITIEEKTMILMKN